MADMTEYSFTAIQITNYDIYIDSSINYEVRDKRHHFDDAKIYDFSSYIKFHGSCMDSQGINDRKYEIIAYGSEAQPGDFDLKLSDCHLQDEKGFRQFRKYRGREVPIYNIPNGIGMLTRLKGSQITFGSAWVSPETITNMLAVLPHVSPIYLSIHERLIEGQRWIIGLTLQTSDPDEE